MKELIPEMKDLNFHTENCHCNEITDPLTTKYIGVKLQNIIDNLSKATLKGRK